jgi:hypothetical protein
VIYKQRGYFSAIVLDYIVLICQWIGVVIINRPPHTVFRRIEGDIGGLKIVSKALRI